MAGQHTQGHAGFTLLLTANAGLVDGVGFLVLFHMFTAHMSGNTIAMGVYVGQGDWPLAFHRGFAVPVFVLGVFLGALLNELMTRRQVRSPLAVAFSCEAGLLLFLIFVQAVPHGDALRAEFTTTFYLVAALPALAMGMQNATVSGSPRVVLRTTFISGALATMAEEAAKLLCWIGGHPQRSRRGWWLIGRLACRQPGLARMLLLGGIWCAYVLGAILGALATVHWGRVALVAPVACLLVTVCWDLLCPLPVVKG